MEMRQRNEEHFRRKFEFAKGTNRNELIKHSRKNSVTYTLMEFDIPYQN